MQRERSVSVHVRGLRLMPKEPAPKVCRPLERTAFICETHPPCFDSVPTFDLPGAFIRKRNRFIEHPEPSIGPALFKKTFRDWNFHFSIPLRSGF